MYFAVTVFLMFASLAQLTETAGFNGPYILVFTLGLLCAIKLHKEEKTGSAVRALSKGVRMLSGFTAFLLAMMVVLSNYAYWLEPSLGEATPRVMKFAFGFAFFCVFFCGTYAAFFNICKYITLYPDSIRWKKAEAPYWNPTKVFLCSFLSISVVYLFVLFFLKYPGLMEPDSYNQIGQALSGKYNNHHPVFHTILIKPALMLGKSLFHDLNAGIAIYCAVQALVMAGIFSYAVMILARLRAPRLLIVLTIMYFALAPYHILLSFTVYKDVYFSGCVLVFCLKQFQLLEREQNSKWDYLAYVVSAIGSCLLRSNGMIAIVLVAMTFVLCFGMKKKKILILLCISMAISYGTKHVLLSALNIPQPDSVESLSIPIQQVTRVIIDHNDLTREEYEQINRIFPVDKAAEIYYPDLSDPVKIAIRETIERDGKVPGWPSNYVGLYLRLGMRHPVTYLKAWIDQTKGYWCSGYVTPIWFNNSFPNRMGLHHTKLLPKLSSVFDYILGCFDEFDFLEPMLSPGFCTWLIILFLFYGIMQKDRAGILICMPALAVFATLLIATPMANEFHYYYCAFCTIPIIIGLVTRDRGTPVEIEM